MTPDPKPLPEVLAKLRLELEAQPAPRTYEVARALSVLDDFDQRRPHSGQAPAGVRKMAHKAAVDLHEHRKRAHSDGAIPSVYVEAGIIEHAFSGQFQNETVASAKSEAAWRPEELDDYESWQRRRRPQRR